MGRLEELKPNAAVRGILPDCLVTVVNVQWFGSEALELTYKDPSGRPANRLRGLDYCESRPIQGLKNARGSEKAPWPGSSSSAPHAG